MRKTRQHEWSIQLNQLIGLRHSEKVVPHTHIHRHRPCGDRPPPNHRRLGFIRIIVACMHRLPRTLERRSDCLAQEPRTTREESHHVSTFCCQCLDLATILSRYSGAVWTPSAPAPAPGLLSPGHSPVLWKKCLLPECSLHGRCRACLGWTVAGRWTIACRCSTMPISMSPGGDHSAIS